MSKYKHLMLDIETMGTQPYSAIVSIGAVEFNIDTGETGKVFYCNISLDDSLKNGFKVDGGTILWWLQQSKEAQHSLLTNQIKVAHALNIFSEFIGDNEYQVWGNSASFDCGLLNNAYMLMKMETPWNFWNERCVRTLVSFAPSIKENYPKPQIAHNALEDCLYQIGYCSAIWNKLKNT